MNKWKFCSHVPYWATQNVQIWSRDKCQSIEDRPNERKWTYDSVVWEPPNFERWLLKILLSRVPLCKVNSRLILECIEFCYWKSFSAVYVRWEYFFSLKEKGLYQYCFKKKNKTKPNQTTTTAITKNTNPSLYFCSVPALVGSLLSSFIQKFLYQNVLPECGEVDLETIQKW